MKLYLDPEIVLFILSTLLIIILYQYKIGKEIPSFVNYQGHITFQVT